MEINAKNKRESISSNPSSKNIRMQRSSSTITTVERLDIAPMNVANQSCELKRISLNLIRYLVEYMILTCQQLIKSVTILEIPWNGRWTWLLLVTSVLIRQCSHPKLLQIVRNYSWETLQVQRLKDKAKLYWRRHRARNSPLTMYFMCRIFTRT